MVLILGILGALTFTVQGRQGSKTSPEAGNDVSGNPRISIDPKLRRALLRVLTKLETEEKNQTFPSESEEIDEQELLETLKQNNIETEANNDSLHSPSPTSSSKSEEEVNAADEFSSTKPPSKEAETFFQFPTSNEEPEYESQTDEFSEELEENSNEFTEENKENSTRQGKTIVESSPSLAQEVQPNDSTEPKNETKPEKHEVEFFPSSLIAAFTVQQDDRGIPRRVIPLNYKNPEEITQDAERALAQREAKLEQELRLLRQQQEIQERELHNLRQVNRLKRPEFDSSSFSQTTSPAVSQLEARRKQQEILLGKKTFEQRLQNEHILREQESFSDEQRLRQEQFFREEQRVREEQLLREQRLREQERQTEEQRRREERLREEQRLQYIREQERLRFHSGKFEVNGLRLGPGVDLQRSIGQEIQVPSSLQSAFPSQTLFQNSFELNRVNRQENPSFIGNPGFNQRPHRELENLLFQSGVTRNIPNSGREDINVISKVLALNHGIPRTHLTPPDLISFGSETKGVFVTPSTVIEPPKASSAQS